MTAKSIWTVILLFLFQSIFAQNAMISIFSSPSKSVIYIDSIFVGKTPLTQFQLEPGIHSVQISSPANSGLWNYEDKHLEIFLNEDQDTTIDVQFAKPVFINSIPYGAHLKTNDEHIGITPLYLPFEPNKGVTFQIIKEGFEPYQFVLKDRKPILAKLRQKEGYVEQEQKAPQLLGLLPKKNIKSKFTLLAITVATHWASFYFKNVADEKFDDYLHTADPQLLNKYWDETRKYDHLSEITLGVSYAALAGLIYMVIWH